MTLVSQLFGGRIAGPVMLLVVRVVFIGMAVLVAVMLPRQKHDLPSGRPTPPPLGPHEGAPAWAGPDQLAHAPSSSAGPPLRSAHAQVLYPLARSCTSRANAESWPSWLKALAC